MDMIQIDSIVGDTLVSATNGMDEVEVFVHNDPYGLLMALLGMSIVFAVLVLLSVVFSYTPGLYVFDFKGWFRKMIPGKKAVVDNAEAAKIPDIKASVLSGEVNAAIAAAIHLYRSEMHDYENTVLTISKVSRVYSPWSSKIYGIRNTPK
jgi:Na+-transporting methylmalonyl-CoA/oxaloacetate decarboxylase gamma subunit